ERLDAEDVKLVVGEAVARIVGEVESLGGHVQDLAGDGVLAFFGAPTTREDDAERAVRCALRIVGEMEEYGREVRRGWGAEGFGVRVGAATGAVVVGEVGAGARVEYAAFGDTVNVAARLQSTAEPGSVLVDDATHRAVEGLFEWGHSRELDLKGKSEPVAAWPVAGIAAAGRPPPARAALREPSRRALSVPRRPARGHARARSVRAHVAALARGAAVADVRGGRPALRAAVRGRTARARTRGPPLGRPDFRTAA